MVLKLYEKRKLKIKPPDTTAQRELLLMLSRALRGRDLSPEAEPEAALLHRYTALPLCAYYHSCLIWLVYYQRFLQDVFIEI